MSRVVITPPSAWSLPPVRELWGAREILFRFAQRDILLRYRQTAIGVVWVLLQPLASAGVFALVFGSVAKLPSGGLPYFVFSYAGMLAWNLFSNIVNRGASSLVANQALVSKVFFPRMLVPLSSVLSVMIDFAVALGLGVVLLFVYGINPGWPVLLFPLWVVLLTLAASGIAMFMSAVMVTYRDVAYVLPWLMQILLYASPVAYALEAVPQNVRWLFDLNPLTWYLELFRFSFLGSAAPPGWQFGAAIGAALVIFVGGALVFQKFERGFADVI